MQMLAIAAMHGTQAYEAACRRHLDAKIKIDAKLANAKARLTTESGVLNSMQLAANQLKKESKADRANRTNIRQHSYFTGAPPKQDQSHMSGNSPGNFKLHEDDNHSHIITIIYSPHLGPLNPLVQVISLETPLAFNQSQQNFCPRSLYRLSCYVT